MSHDEEGDNRDVVDEIVVHVSASSSKLEHSVTTTKESRHTKSSNIEGAEVSIPSSSRGKQDSESYIPPEEQQVFMEEDQTLMPQTSSSKYKHLDSQDNVGITFMSNYPKTQQKNEACYTEQLDTLFNIAFVNALDKNSPNPLQQTRIEEDRAFLADQRGCRKMFMTSEDKEMAAQQEQVHDKQQKQLLRKENEEKRQQQTMEGESGENETESCESSNQFEVLDEYEPSSSSTKKRTNKMEIGCHTALFTKHVTSALDRNQTSDREALRLMIPIAAVLGHDPSSLTVSRRARKKARCEQAADIKEEGQLKRFVQFGALLYTKSWIQAPCAAEAPGGDLLLWKNLQQYQSIDYDISIAAQKILQNHMWYLSNETVSLALFSAEVSPIEKQKIITGFGIEPSERHVRSDPSLLQIEDVSLGHFSTRRSQNLLTKLQIGHSFLVLPPEQWNDNTDYQKGKQRINDLRLVNDTAERKVKLFEDYNRLLTKNEKEKQFILQVVEANRKVIPAQTTKKSVICAVSV
ncbi:hypothetical protein Bpfe_030260 [Biomphalaria pfeifferi]|uniref:Uncharacterized protein n=1 Tax=Biomphalaria pfeifferi TaxID=112525 RepID=A0AAD8AQX8_BIOPF|nr:hypothetical protein Bpfe_030260 [Biomphalaria pfeifferi]